MSIDCHKGLGVSIEALIGRASLTRLCGVNMGWSIINAGWHRAFAWHPFSASSACVNFVLEEGAERVRASFRRNYDKRAKINTKYDPGIFSL